MKFFLPVLLFTAMCASGECIPADGNSLLRAFRSADKTANGKKVSDDEAIDSLCVTGYLGGFLNSSKIWARSPTGSAFKVPLGVTVGQFQQIVAKYLSEHPEKLHENAAVLVFQALREAFGSPRPSK
jgi:hypothetical protein